MALKVLIKTDHSEFNSDIFLIFENRRIKNVNVVCIFTISSILSYILFYSIVDYRHFQPVIITFTILSLFFISTLVLNIRFGLHQLAKFFLIAGLTIMSFITTGLFFGKSPGFHFFFLLIAFIPAFIWSHKHRSFILLFAAINCLGFLTIEFIPFLFNSFVSIPENLVPYLYRSSLLICLGGMGIAIFINQISSNVKEIKLEEHNNKLLEGNYQISEQKDKIEKQKKELADLNTALKSKVSELTKSHEELKISNEQRDKIYSIIAHDLRTPFNAVVGLISFLLNDYDSYTDKKKKEYLSNIADTTRSSYILLENLLEWSRMRIDGLKLNLKTFNLFEKIQESISILTENARKKEISINNNINNDWYIKADMHMTATIFRNLVSNAIKFTRAKGSVTISGSETDEGKYLICVRDTGIGIRSEALKGLFSIDNTYQLSGTSKEKGTGFGLMICKEFIENSNDKIWVESEPGNGSSFYFTMNKA